LNGIGYMMDNAGGTMSSYNPAGNAFTVLNTFPFFTFSYQDGVVNRDTIYLMSNLSLFRYDFSLNSWVEINYLPMGIYGHGVAFSLNNKIYYGLTQYSEISRYFSEYDPDRKTWISKKSFPDLSSAPAATYFTINNTGYALFMDQTFCQYNPDTDNWIKLASFPFEVAPGCVSFVINNKAYVGLGDTGISDPRYADFWVYDPLTNVWTKNTSMPGGQRYNSIAFVINGKAYIGFGYKSSTKQKDFFVFDPNYTVK
jgi:N-acetylneuraminic acid mutarotase